MLFCIVEAWIGFFLCLHEIFRVLKDGGLMRIWRNHEKCKEVTTKQEVLEA